MYGSILMKSGIWKLNSRDDLLNMGIDKYTPGDHICGEHLFEIEMLSGISQKILHTLLYQYFGN